MKHQTDWNAVLEEAAEEVLHQGLRQEAELILKARAEIEWLRELVVAAYSEGLMQQPMFPKRFCDTSTGQEFYEPE